VHFSSKLRCGLANFGIAHWPSFLENTADRRRDQRRREYGDERDAGVRAFLARISPLNNAEKITVPLSIAHGEEDSRVPVSEALRLWDKNACTELMVCELEGHGKLPQPTMYPGRKESDPRGGTDARFFSFSFEFRTQGSSRRA
jgi:dipeptidyl aminopeptidase/acylaminoacyl peptidase